MSEANNVNEPMPWQTLVEQLREALSEVPDGVPVAVRIPPGVGHDELTIVTNVYLREYAGGPIALLDVGKPPGWNDDE